MDGWITIGTKIDTKNFDAQIKSLEDKLDTLEQEHEAALKDVEFPQDQLLRYEKEIEQTRNKLTDLYRKQNDINNAGFNKVQNSLKSVGNSLTDVIKKVAKWSLAIIGIRSVYLGIRQAMGTLMQYDNELQANVNYLKFALANTLKPVIEWIVNAMYQILGAIGQIIYYVSGYNIFEKSGIKDYEKSMKSSVGSARELKKTLAGFDEMNVIQDASSSGGGASTTTPTMDLSKMVTDTGWIDEMIQNTQEKVLELGYSFQTVGQEMKNALANPSVFNEAYGYWGTFVKGITKIFYGVYEVINGLSEVVAGVVLIIGGLFTGNFEAIKIGWELLKESIVDIVFGIQHVVEGVFETIFGIIKGIIGTLIDMFIAFANGVIQAFQDALTAVKNTWKTIKDWFASSVIQPLLDKWNSFKTKVTNVFGDIKTKATDIFGTIKTFVVDKVVNPIQKAFDGLKTGITSVLTGIGNVFRSIGNIFIDGINLIIKGLNLLSIDVPKWVPKYGGNKWGFNIPLIPRLARGGIVNNPGQGVNMGSYIAGERGSEAVIPLNEETMDRLGEAIARHMNISANITNTMNGRVISRELHKINAENSFAFNS